MKYTLKSIISISFLFSAYIGFAQEEQITTEITTTITEVTPKKEATTLQGPPPSYPQRYGFRVGADLFRLTRSIYDKTYSGFELVGDYRLTKKWYAVAEVGHDKMTRDNNTYGFTTNGNYIRVGGDFNLYENWLNAEDQIFVGFRYGFSSFSQTLNWYEVYTTNPYFPSQVHDVNKKYSGLSAHWVEFVAGVKTRVFNNVFMGFSLRLNGLLSQKQPEDFENLYIPGFNKKHSGSIGVGFNYTITYLIPFYKSKKKAFVIPESETKYDLEGNAIQSEDLKMIEANKKKYNN